MDPELRDWRVGPSWLLLFFIVFAPPLHTTPVGGQAHKGFRNFPFAETPAGVPRGELFSGFEGDGLSPLEPDRGLPAPAASEAPGSEVASIESVASPSAAGAWTSPASEDSASAIGTSFGLSSTAHAYLPASGAIPLRFAPARGWPAPLPDGEPGTPIEEREDESPHAPPALGRTEPSAPSTVEAEPARETVVQAGSRPGAKSPAVGPDARTLLSADLVLGFIDQIDGPDRGRVGRFLPAIPNEAKPASTTAFPRLP